MGGKGGSPSPPLLAKGAGPRLRVRARPAQATPRGPGSRCQRGGERACPKGCTRGRRGQESGAPVCGVGGGRQAFESAACNWQLVTSGRRCVLVWGGRAQRDDGRRAGAGGRVRESRSAADPAAAPRGRPKQTAKSATGARERRCAGQRGGGRVPRRPRRMLRARCRVWEGWGRAMGPGGRSRAAVQNWRAAADTRPGRAGRRAGACAALALLSRSRQCLAPRARHGRAQTGGRAS